MAQVPLSRRDSLAGMILQGFLASSKVFWTGTAMQVVEGVNKEVRLTATPEDTMKKMIAVSVLYADSLIAELDVPTMSDKQKKDHLATLGTK